LFNITQYFLRVWDLLSNIFPGENTVTLAALAIFGGKLKGIDLYKKVDVSRIVTYLRRKSRKLRVVYLF
jgi:hypothetical protein